MPEYRDFEHWGLVVETWIVVQQRYLKGIFDFRYADLQAATKYWSKGKDAKASLPTACASSTAILEQA